MLELFHLRKVECVALKTAQLVNIGLKCFVTFHSKVSAKCHMLLEAAILVLSVDNSIMENTQKEVVKRVSLNNQVAPILHVCFKQGSACELASN